jgi:chemotaxis protein MotB
MVTYGDMMSLLLCFFVMLAAMSDIKTDDNKFRLAMASLRQAFDGSGTAPATAAALSGPDALLCRLQEIILPKSDPAASDDSVSPAADFRVTDVDAGIQVEIHGAVAFQRFGAGLGDEARLLLEQIAARTRGHQTVIEITGHATREAQPVGSPWSDHWDLAYARARAARDALVSAGVAGERIRLISAGAVAPADKDPRAEARHAQNRRIEVVITETTVPVAETPADREQEQE